MAISRAPGIFQDGGRRFAVEIDFRIGEVGHDEQVVAAAEIDDLPVEIEIDDLRRRVRREVQDQRGRRRHRVAHRPVQLAEIIVRRRQRQMANRGAGDDEGVAVDRVGRVRRDNHVTRRDDGLGQIDEALLGAEVDHDLPLRIDCHVVAPLVVGGDRPAQPGNAARGRIAVGPGVADGLDQLVDDVGRRRAVRVAHAEVDDVLAGRPRPVLHRVDLGEQVGRQALEAVEGFGGRHRPAVPLRRGKRATAWAPVRRTCRYRPARPSPCPCGRGSCSPARPRSSGRS